MKWLLALLSISLFIVAPDSAFGKSAVVVELFTSQGCSSCPPADELLTKTKRLIADEPIYFLAFHVTYWDYLGWMDPYGQEQFTKRQRYYAALHKEQSLFTPQFRVNGGSGFADYSGRKLNSSIKAAQQLSDRVTINFNNLSMKNNSLAVEITTHAQKGSTLKNAVLQLALTEDRLVSNVTAGENHGKHLKSYAVVRWFKTIKLNHGQTNTTTQSIPINPKWKKAQLELIAYIQDHTSGQILGALGKSLIK